MSYCSINVNSVRRCASDRSVYIYTIFSTSDWRVYLNTHIIAGDCRRVYLNGNISSVDWSVYLNTHIITVDRGVYLNTHIRYIHLFDIYVYTCGTTGDSSISVVYIHNIITCRYTTGNIDTYRSKQRFSFFINLYYDITFDLYTDTIEAGDSFIHITRSNVYTGGITSAYTIVNLYGSGIIPRYTTNT